MADNEDLSELLFFDTFSHEVDTDINLDLVQFPKPVYITQVRIIPLGARVQADFPGGVRLGATNPSKFDIEFFVNDLGVQGASTFENLGRLEYNQNDCIHLECTEDKIPTDGLVLRGWYSTITLAVYGILTKAMNEPIASPPPPPPCEEAAVEEICSLIGDGRAPVLSDEPVKEDWKEPHTSEVAHSHKISSSDYERSDLDYNMSREHYHHSGDERDRRNRRSSQSPQHSPPHPSLPSSSSSSRKRTVSDNNERDFMRSRNDRNTNERDKAGRDWSRSPEYTRVSRHKHSERTRSETEDSHKWPRTPPTSIDSPARPRSPDNLEYTDESCTPFKLKSRAYMRSTDSTVGDSGHIEDDEIPGTPDEPFEPILSDDEIIGEDDTNENVTLVNVISEEIEMEIEAGVKRAIPAITKFDPFIMPVEYFESDANILYGKELDNLKLIFKNMEIQPKYQSLDSFKEASTTTEERESFVFASEQLINQLAYLAQNYKRRKYVLKQFFQKEQQQNFQVAFSILQIALNYDAACLQTQPTYKIRHIKIGAKLAELLGSYEDFIEYIFVVKEFDLCNAIFRLYHQEYMAPPIKLMLLKAIYAILDAKSGFKQFVVAKINGYQMLFEMLQRTKLTRTKYSIRAIIKKLNLNENIEVIREKSLQLFVLNNLNVEESRKTFIELECLIEQLINALTVDALSYQQPKRFLPVSKKFEIISDALAQRSYEYMLQTYFNRHLLGDSLLILMTNADVLPKTLLFATTKLIKALLQTHVGLDYLVDDCFKATQVLIAIMLGLEDLPQTKTEPAIVVKEEKCPVSTSDESKVVDNEAEIKTPTSDALNDEQTITTVTPKQEPVETTATDTKQPFIIIQKPKLNHLQKLAIDLAFKVQTRYHLDAIIYMMAAPNDYDTLLLTKHLHALYSQVSDAVGRHYTLEIFAFNKNIQIFIDLIKMEQRLQIQKQIITPGLKYKSPILSYAVDLIDICIRFSDNLNYLQENGEIFFDLIKNHETFEPSISAILQEMYVYLKPLEVTKVGAYNDITPLFEIITRSLEYITTFPGDLIIALRMLRYLTLSPEQNTTISSETFELKHRFVLLQFYAMDGVQTLLHILEKLYLYFEQPGVHGPALITQQGVLSCQLILPTLQVLRKLLSFAIQCRDVQFKDLSAIDHLMRTYQLLHYFPQNSEIYDDVDLAKKEILQIFLAYTQPNEQDEESLHKSLWTQMIREVLNNINSPSSFIPGLIVLSELLPLPLPMPTVAHASSYVEADYQRLVTERKLWSAHLHPLSTQIARLIETIAPTSLTMLSKLLSRVCLQLADLAPNMTLLISKTLMDLICNEYNNGANVATAQLSRLLIFFRRCSSYASLKSSALCILSGKLWDIFQNILTLQEPNELAIKCQKSIQKIMKNFLNTEISLISLQSGPVSELNLASALPPKELLQRIAESLLTNLINANLNKEIILLSLQNLIELTKHDVTFYNLVLAIKQRSNDLQKWLQNLIEQSINDENLEILKIIAQLLVKLVQAEEKVDEIILKKLQRSLKITNYDLVTVFGLKNEYNSKNIIENLRHLIDEYKVDDNDNKIINSLDQLIQQLSENNAIDEDDLFGTLIEPNLPQTEGIVTQYATRPIINFYDEKTIEEKLSIDSCFALADDDDDDDNCNDIVMKDVNRIVCDLTEMANEFLPADANLTNDCKRVLHLSASPQSNRERTPTAPCFRTRRVEVEPTTGRPEKKIYVTPVRGRGFQRAPPTRGDLFRSRPPNTSRPPSLHVDDFLALETCGAQPTGPTGYNKIPPIMRGTRIGRSRGSRISPAVAFRKTKLLRTAAPSTWNDPNIPPHYRMGPIDPHFPIEPPHYQMAHFGRGMRGMRGQRARPPYLR